MIAAEQIKNPNIVRGVPIRTIFSGFASRGDSNRTRKAHIREAKKTQA